MIRINLDMDMPEECHECPFQLKFKDDEVDAWYMRRCVIMQRKIEYPRPGWCPLKEQEAKQVLSVADSVGEMEVEYCPSCRRGIANKTSDPTKFCRYCGQAVKWE